MTQQQGELIGSLIKDTVSSVAQGSPLRHVRCGEEGRIGLVTVTSIGQRVLEYRVKRGAEGEVRVHYLYQRSRKFLPPTGTSGRMGGDTWGCEALRDDNKDDARILSRKPADTTIALCITR
ncbi:hypothetical protein E2C01_001168 [Portunus trituberculatus]|uniref:Uncharacterized protein n=1 Tax=Portunus trituberculatus TaxID=210409 RepID=A0A5B7CGX9_PORTR|nr:hypothetical protein [Portunus trituberculatus]